jgi:hypothetical protein
LVSVVETEIGNLGHLNCWENVSGHRPDIMVKGFNVLTRCR